MIRPGYYTMKRMMGGVKPTPRDLLLQWYPCPGCFAHQIACSRRKNILFNNYNKRSHKAWITYWRIHSDEYELMCRQ